MLPDLSHAAMAWITVGILAVYVGGIVFAILAPQKQHDPQRGMAVGCLVLCTIPAIMLGILVAVGVAWDVPRLVRWPFVICTIVLGYVAVMLIAQFVVSMWRRRQRRA